MISLFNHWLFLSWKHRIWNYKNGEKIVLADDEQVLNNQSKLIKNHSTEKFDEIKKTPVNLKIIPH